MGRLFFLGSAFVLALAFAAFSGAKSTSAQYPAVAGALTLSADATTVTTGMNTPYVCRIFHTSGQPIPNVPCTISIVSEPGTDAAVGSKVVTIYTDAFGRAIGNLYVGTTPGNIVLRATYRDLSAQTVVQVVPLPVVVAPVVRPNLGGLFVGVPNPHAVQPSAPVAAVAPASPVSAGTIRPPATGDAGLASGGTQTSFLASGLIVALVVGGAAAARSRRPGRVQS